MRFGKRLATGLTVLIFWTGVSAGSDWAERKLDPALKLLYRGQAAVAAGKSRDLTEELEILALLQPVPRSAASIESLSVIVLFEGAESRLQEAGFRVQGHLGKAYTGTLKPEDLSRLAELKGVQAIHLSQPLYALRASPGESERLEEAAAAPIPITAGAGVLIGFVDTGVDIQHEDFRLPDGRTRIKYLLDLSDPGDVDGDGVLDGPDAFGGTLYTEDEINQALQSSTPLRQKDSTGHGTHGLSIAAGDDPRYPGVAPGASLIVVNAARVKGTVEFESSDMINALSFIDRQAALLGMPYVANLSLGTSYGPHDGKTLEEIAIDSLVGPGKPGKVIVIAAGNSGDSTGRELRHLQGMAFAGLATHHTLIVPKYDHPSPGKGNNRVLVDLWYRGGDRLAITVTAPDGQTRVEADYGQFANEATAFGEVFIANPGGASPLNGDTEAVVLLDDQSGTAPASGQWTITVTGEEVEGGGVYHGWLVDGFSEVGGEAPYFAGAADNSFLVARPGTARNAITVGSFARHDPATRYRTSWTDVHGILRKDGTARPESISGFSSSGFTRDGRVKPELTAPGEQVRGAVSHDAYPGVSSRSIYALHPFPQIDALIVSNGKNKAFGMLQGTSFSTPVVTGLAARILAVNPGLDAVQVRNILINSAKADAKTGAVPNERWGYGKVDLGIAPRPSSPLPGSLRILPDRLPAGAVGDSYSVTLDASGGQPPYGWRLAAGSLPPGLTLAGGLLAGIPASAGTYRFTVRVADSSAPAKEVARQVSLQIAPTAPLAVANLYLGIARVGKTYREALQAQGGNPPYRWSLLGGSMPPGIAFTSSGTLEGAPSQVGRYAFTAQVADNSSRVARQSFTVAVSGEAGSQWSPLGMLASGAVNAIALDPADRRRIAVGLSDLTFGAVALSENGGDSWTDISMNRGLDAPYQGVRRLGFDSTSSTLWALGEIFERPYEYDRGTGLWSRWSYCSSEEFYNERIDDLSFDRAGSLYILPYFLSCQGASGKIESYNGFLKSPDGGHTWLEGGHFSGGIGPGNQFQSSGQLSVYGPDPSFMYASRMEICTNTSFCQEGELVQKPYRSTDGGGHWEEMVAGAPDLVRMTVSQQDPLDVVRFSSGVVPKSPDGGAPSSYLERSRDGGATWSRIPLPGGSSLCLFERSQSDPDLMLLTTSTGLHRTVDGGRNWTPLKIPFVSTTGACYLQGLRSLAIDPADPEVIWAGSSQRGLFESTDGGSSWSARNNGLVYFGSESVAISPFDPSQAFVNTSQGGFVSRNGGLRWTRSETFAGNPVFSSRPGRVYLVESHSRIILRSENGGVTWPALSTVGDQERIVSLAVDPRDPESLTAETAHEDSSTTWTTKLWRSADGGDTWSPLPNVATPPRYLLDRTEPLLAYAQDVAGRLFTTGDDGFYRSDDGGQSWHRLPSPDLRVLMVNSIKPAPSDSEYLYAAVSVPTPGLYAFGPQGSVTYTYSASTTFFQSLAVDPHDPRVAYAGARGVYKTMNGGQTWSFLSSVLDNLTVVSLVTHPERSGVVYAGTLENGVFLSEDGGESWRSLDAFGTVADLVNAVAVPPSDPQKIYAATEGFGVQVSTDAGQSFLPRVDGLGNLDVLSLGVDRDDSELLFAGTRKGLFKTQNGGAIWTATDVTDGTVTDISIDGARPRRVRISTFGGGFEESDDEGETFHASNQGLSSLALTSIEPQVRGDAVRLWVTMKGGDGVAFSDNDGRSWTSAAGEGLVNRNVNDLLVGPGEQLWVATDGGVFVSNDGGLHWRGGGIGLPAGVPATSLAIDPGSGEILVSLFSGPDGGVYRGGTGGAVWRSFNAGLDELRVQKLTVAETAQGDVSFYAATAGDGLYASFLESLGSQLPSIATRSLPRGHVGEQYSVGLAATGGAKPYRWSLAAGALPPGLGLTAEGAIVGKPVLDGSYGFTVQVTDANANFARKELSIVSSTNER